MNRQAVFRYVTMAPFSDIKGVPIFDVPSGAMAPPLPLPPIICPWLPLGPPEAWLNPSTCKTTDYWFICPFRLELFHVYCKLKLVCYNLIKLKCFVQSKTVKDYRH